MSAWRWPRSLRDDAKREHPLRRLHRHVNGGKWRNPLVVGIFAAAVAAMGNALVSYTNAHAQRELEAQKAEQARILEMIKTGEPDKAAENLRFLVNAGLIVDATLKQSVNSFLATRKPGSGPSLPSVSNVPKLAAPIVDNARVYLLAGKRDKAAHLPELKQNLGNAGFAVINARYIEDVGQPGLHRDLAGAVRGHDGIGRHAS